MKGHKRKHQKRHEHTRRNALPKNVEESNSIGILAGDATSGVPETPGEWAADEPLENRPTFPLEPGDPSPLQPAAGSPHSKHDKTPEGEGKERERPPRRAA